METCFINQGSFFRYLEATGFIYVLFDHWRNIWFTKSFRYDVMEKTIHRNIDLASYAQYYDARNSAFQPFKLVCTICRIKPLSIYYNSFYFVIKAKRNILNSDFTSIDNQSRTAQISPFSYNIHP